MFLPEFTCILAGLFLLPLLMPWWKWLAGCVALAAAVSLALWLDHMHAISLEAHNPGDLMEEIFLFLTQAAFAAGVVARLSIVAVLSFTDRKHYGDLRPLIRWWKRRRSVELDWPFKLLLLGSFSITAMVIVIPELVVLWGRYPSGRSDPLLCAGIFVAVPLGCAFCEAPVRWSLACALPCALLTLQMARLSLDYVGSPPWDFTCDDVTRFLIEFVAFGALGAHLRYAGRRES